MSYDIYLTDPVTGKTIEFDKPHQLKGGTYALGGTTEAWLNITYNYAKHFKNIGPKGIRSIYGMKAWESVPHLKAVIDQLKDDVSDNYWESTEGNAKQALINLVKLAKLAPHGIWDGD